MQILSVTGGLAQTNCFLIADEAARQAVLFDAPDHTVAPLLDAAEARDWEIVGLWLTHGHFDHLADHKVVTDRFPGARVLIHELDAPKLRRPGSAVFPLPFVIPPREPDELVADGQRLRFGTLACEVILTPGHSPGHVMYHFGDEGVLVGGDLIIGGAIGRTDLPDSDESAMTSSVRRAMRLPDATQLLPGHGQPTTLGEERRTNPYVRAMIAGEAK